MGSRDGSEAEIHFELYRHLKNALDEKHHYHGIELSDVLPEKSVDGGFADIAVQDATGRTFLVIEAKRKTTHGYQRDIDPYAPKVIEQAFSYANKLGAPYFATYNGGQLVLFKTFERGVPLLERKSRAYQVTDPAKFAPEILEQVTGLEKEQIGWEPKSRTFVKRLKTFHGRLTTHFLRALTHKLKDKHFQKALDHWVEKQGWKISPQEQRSRFANQAAYLFMNKLFFYKVLEDTGHDVPVLSFSELADPEKRRDVFKRVTREVDFEPIYEHDPIFDAIPLSARMKREVRDFVEELDQYDLSQFKHDTIGHIYEDTISPQVRHDLGQYYTPPKIVDLIVRLTVKDPNDKVLDPGCGSGTFLISAYNRLKELKEQSGQTPKHTQLLSQVFGVDINRFPAHLSAINLALQNLGAKTEHVNIEIQDFFHLVPYQGRIGIEKGGEKPGKKAGKEHNIPPQVDVVVANPPYIRQELIPDKPVSRKHLKRIGYEAIGEQADIYVYFFTHAYEFLERADHGQVGFITSDKWLTVGYGEDLQQFFLDNFRIKAIISFSKRLFEVPLVSTCVTILEKCDSKKDRDANTVKFLRVKGHVPVDRLVQIVEMEHQEPDTLTEDEKYRVVTKKQADLQEIGKWNRFLYAPPIYWQLLNHEKICRLGDVAQVRFGTKTGANDFFYLKQDEAKHWGIDEQFLRPVAKSVRQVQTAEFTQDDTDVVVIDVHDYVKFKLQSISHDRLRGIKLENTNLPADADVKDLSLQEEYILWCLQKDSHHGLFRYIVSAMWEKDWGHHKPPHQRPTCKQHRQRNGCWFDLGQLKTPPLLLSKEYWKYGRPLSVLNSSAIPDQQMYAVQSTQQDPVLLCSILNSSLGAFFREFHGRTTGGGMNRLTVAEAQVIPILNPDSLTTSQKRRIIRAFKQMRKQSQVTGPQLDRAILAPLQIEHKAEEIKAFAHALSKTRREGAEISEMIADAEKQDTQELKGAKIVSEGKSQKSLGDFG